MLPIIQRWFNANITLRGNATYYLSNGAALAHLPIEHITNNKSLTYEHRGKLLLISGESIQLPTLAEEIDQIETTLKNIGPYHLMIRADLNNTINDGTSNQPFYPLRPGESRRLIANALAQQWVCL